MELCVDVIKRQPYANPFRTYALEQDFNKFKALFKDRGVDCYIVNTGFFLDKKIPKEVTIGILESIIDETAKPVPFHKFKGMEYMEVKGFEPDFKDNKYIDLVKGSIQNRINYVESLEDFKGGRDKLPKEAMDALLELLK